MNDDEMLEQEVRASLRASATRPIPEELVSRIGAIPAGQPSSQATASRLPRYARFAAELAAAAVVVVAVSALILVRNGGNTPGGPLGPGSTSPATPAASAAPAAVATPSPEPSATPGEAVAPPAVLGFEPASVTFVSADAGWVLGTGTCASGPCAAMARTGDGGTTWSPAPAPPAVVVGGPGQGASGISGLRFANLQDGWAYGPNLWATHDGGTTWARVTIPGLAANAPVFALETAGGIVHAAVLDGGNFRVASSPVAGDNWTVSPVQVPVGAGPVPAVQLVLSGAAGWLVRTTGRSSEGHASPAAPGSPGRRRAPTSSARPSWPRPVRRSLSRPATLGSGATRRATTCTCPTTAAPPSPRRGRRHR